MEVITVGPVIGFVSHESARILVEASESLLLDVQIIEHASSQIKLVSQLQTLQNKPVAFTVSQLSPDTEYRALFLYQNIPIPNRTGSFRTASLDPSEMKIACVSGNNFHHRSRRHSWNLWEVMCKEVQSHRLDLVLHMGDQIFSQSLEHNVGQDVSDALRSIRAQGRMPTPEEDETLLELYRKLYRKAWNTPALKKVLSSTSNLMIWNDNEVKSGFGSNISDVDQTSTEWYQGNRIARRVYWEYQSQLHEMIHEKISTRYCGHEGYMVRFGPAGNSIGILFLDVRGARQQADVPMLGGAQWRSITSWLSDSSVQTLLLVSPTPLCFMSRKATKNLSILPSMKYLRDQWIYKGHEDEMVRLLQLFQNWKLQSPQRQLILLGGNQSIGGFSQVMFQDRLFAYQLIASPITNNHMSQCKGEFMKRHLLHSYSNKILEIGFGFCFQHLKMVNKRNYGSIRIVWEKDGQEKTEGADKQQQHNEPKHAGDQNNGLLRTGLEVEHFTSMETETLKAPRIHLSLVVQE